MTNVEIEVHVHLDRLVELAAGSTSLRIVSTGDTPARDR
jgi:hypothetical protein